jgi:alpha-amylase
MSQFRSTVLGTAVTNWWDNGNNQIAFCRGDKGFIAINGDTMDLTGPFQVKIPYSKNSLNFYMESRSRAEL